MKKYNLKQATEEVGRILGYAVCYTSMNIYKRKGYLVSSSTEYHEIMNRTYPMYTDEDLTGFLVIYKKLLATREIRQIRKNKLPVDS